MRHLKLDLTEDAAMEFIDPMRPLITMWPENEEGKDVVSVSIGSAWGAAQRYLTLKPEEARTLAQLLVLAAERAEALSLETAEP